MKDITEPGSRKRSTHRKFFMGFDTGGAVTSDTAIQTVSWFRFRDVHKGETVTVAGELGDLPP